MNLKILKYIDITQGDEKTIKITLNIDSTEILDFSNYKVRYTIKDYRSAIKGEPNYLLKKSEIPIINNIIEIKLYPEETIKLPVTKPNKPLIMAIGIYNKEERYSKEFLIGLNIYPAVNNNLY